MARRQRLTHLSLIRPPQAAAPGADGLTSGADAASAMITANQRPQVSIDGRLYWLVPVDSVTVDAFGSCDPPNLGAATPPAQRRFAADEAFLDRPSSERTTRHFASLLTARELQIAALVAEGLVNKQIAAELEISEWTVSTHLRRVFAKLKVDTRAAMVARCFGAG